MGISGVGLAGSFLSTETKELEEIDIVSSKDGMLTPTVLTILCNLLEERTEKGFCIALPLSLDEQGL